MKLKRTRFEFVCDNDKCRKVEEVLIHSDKRYREDGPLPSGWRKVKISGIGNLDLCLECCNNILGSLVPSKPEPQAVVFDPDEDMGLATDAMNVTVENVFTSTDMSLSEGVQGVLSTTIHP